MEQSTNIPNQLVTSMGNFSEILERLKYNYKDLPEHAVSDGEDNGSEYNEARQDLAELMQEVETTDIDQSGEIQKAVSQLEELIIDDAVSFGDKDIEGFCDDYATMWQAFWDLLNIPGSWSAIEALLPQLDTYVTEFTQALNNRIKASRIENIKTVEVSQALLPEHIPPFGSKVNNLFGLMCQLGSLLHGFTEKELLAKFAKVEATKKDIGEDFGSFFRQIHDMENIMRSWEILVCTLNTGCSNNHFETVYDWYLHTEGSCITKTLNILRGMFDERYAKCSAWLERSPRMEVAHWNDAPFNIILDLWKILQETMEVIEGWRDSLKSAQQYIGDVIILHAFKNYELEFRRRAALFQQYALQTKKYFSTYEKLYYFNNFTNEQDTLDLRKFIGVRSFQKSFCSSAAKIKSSQEECQTYLAHAQNLNANASSSNPAP